MAKIFLNIEAEDAADLRHTLVELANVTTFKVDYAAALAEQVQEREEMPDARSTQDVEPGEQPKKRGRPKSSAATSESPSPSGPSTAASDPSKNSASSDGKGSSPDPFMEQVKQAAAETAASDQQPTMEAVRKAMSAYLQVDGHNAGGLQKILKEIAGAERMSDVPAEKYAAVLAALTAES